MVVKSFPTIYYTPRSDKKITKSFLTKEDDLLNTTESISSTASKTSVQPPETVSSKRVTE